MKLQSQRAPRPATAPPDPAPGLLAACLTAPGEGALAIWRVRGPDLQALLQRVFRPSRAEGVAPGARVVHGHLVDGELPVDEILLLGDGSGTEVELSTHGGPATRAAVARLLERSGVEVAGGADLPGGEAGRRGRAVHAEAHALLARDRTLQGLLFHAAALDGALVDEVDALRGACGRGAPEPLLGRLRTLVARSAVGRAFAEPPRLVVLGEPNVGKSTLCNRLLGTDRSLVTAEPGTTRDLVRTLGALQGYPFAVVDGAGLRDTGDPVEAEGIRRVEAAAREATVVVLLADAAAPERAAGLLEARPELAARVSLLGLNKADRVPDAVRVARELAERLGLPAYAVSATEGDGVDRLVDAVLFRSPFAGPATRDLPVPFTRRQVEGLTRALEALRAGAPESARRALHDVLEGAE